MRVRKHSTNVNMSKKEHEKRAIMYKSKKRLRKESFENHTVLEILRTVGITSNEPMSPIRIAKDVSGEEGDKSKFSYEIQEIKMLTSAGFLKRFLKPEIGERLSKVYNEYKDAKFEHFNYEVYCQKQISNRRTSSSAKSISSSTKGEEKPNATTNNIDTNANPNTEPSELRSRLACDFEKLLTVEEKQIFDDKYCQVISTYEHLQDIILDIFRTAGTNVQKTPNSTINTIATNTNTELSQLADDYLKLRTMEEKKIFETHMTYKQLQSIAEEIFRQKEENNSLEKKVKLVIEDNDVSVEKRAKIIKIVNYGATAAGSSGISLKRKSWIYALTFSGLLLYLYNEFKAEERITGKKNEGKEKVSIGQTRANIIRKVLKNPFVLKETPLLKDWEYFEKYGFQIINLLLQIANELESHLYNTTPKTTTSSLTLDKISNHLLEYNTYNLEELENHLWELKLATAYKDKYYLLERASKLYFTELENHLWELLESPLYIFHLKDAGTEKFGELLRVRNRYRQNVIIPMLNEFRKNDTELIEYLQRECDSFSSSSQT